MFLYESKHVLLNHIGWSLRLPRCCHRCPMYSKCPAWKAWRTSLTFFIIQPSYPIGHCTTTDILFLNYWGPFYSHQLPTSGSLSSSAVYCNSLLMGLPECITHDPAQNMFDQAGSLTWKVLPAILLFAIHSFDWTWTFQPSLTWSSHSSGEERRKAGTYVSCQII